ncbi:hypothetical protein [Variovorax saccharolyticus]|uniref:hypothetical protein n=1 Tax=Variovorax saccharolyticus TaxID=3053516 RepID=UPI002578D955|nr:hypothetical protein [Variovorax sp. J31P216]MDM0029167.1 hypothetical protein [Variovorax sp. J31P216]
MKPLYPATRDRARCGVLASFIAVASIVIGGHSSVTAAQISIDGDVAVVTGMLSAQDAQSLEAPNVKKIIFLHSLGGTMEAVHAYVEVIKRRQLDTEVKGKCFSACALSFLAGKQRLVDKSTQNAISFHVARVLDHGVLRPSKNNEAVLKMIDELSGGKMREPARSKIAASWGAGQGVVFVIGPGLFGQRSNTFYCDGSQGTDGSKCALLFDADPYDLGVLTRE